ncbi:MAG: biotin--[acetyl-CoA-carboxylase] ligase [Anaerolineae bacterium]|nr:biotin--[acetyl-CoA-carboxylase] ligase [Anaerolineae bacterium]
MLNVERVRAGLMTHTFGRALVYRTCVESTNDVAKELAGQGALEGTLVVADEQTAGRGRMGRHWVAPAGTCLLCSILFRPHLPPARAGWLTMVCALAAADAVEDVAGLHVALKWPNDLVVTGWPWRKLAGVLTETSVQGAHVDSAVVGVGLNVNVPPEALPGLAPDATSILAESGRAVERERLLAVMLHGIERRYAQVCAGASPHVEWAGRLATLGRRVRAVTAQGTLNGVAEGVDESGALDLRTDDGRRVSLTAADVSLRLEP